MALGYAPNRLRGPVNAALFTVLDGSFDRALGARKRRLLADLPDEVVELGPGVGANLRYLRPGTRLVAVEPNPAMHARLRARAAARGVDLDLRDVVGERIDLPDASADVVICTLVLCTVADPGRVAAEVLRILHPGGRFVLLEHVAAPPGTRTRRLQHALAGPWAWCFEGCDLQRDTATLLRHAGFASVDLESYAMRSPLVPINAQIAGTAVKAAATGLGVSR